MFLEHDNLFMPFAAFTTIVRYGQLASKTRIFSLVLVANFLSKMIAVCVLSKYLLQVHSPMPSSAAAYSMNCTNKMDNETASHHLDDCF